MIRPRILLTLIVGAMVSVAGLAGAQTRGVDKSYMNPAVAPCEDFFSYCNGAWVDTVQIPASYVGMSEGREIFDRNQEVLRAVVEAAAANRANEQDATVRKVGILYAALMDSARSNRDGLAPIKPLLAQITGIKTRADMLGVIASFSASGLNAPFGLAGETDLKNSAMVIGTLNQGGLGLPDRDFYFRPDPKTEAVRKAYMAYAVKSFEMLGETPEQAQADAQKVFAIETALAESSMTRVAMREPEAIYHNISVAELQKMAPGFDWIAYFKAAGLTTLAKPAGRLNVVAPSFARQVGNVMKNTPIDDWKAYLRFFVVRSNAGWIGDDWYSERFKYTAVISGQKVPAPRWKRAIQTVDGAMGEAVGKAFVAKTFTPADKAGMKDLVDDLQGALAERLAALDWMGPETKAAALKKLAAFTKKIGYPDVWRDYSSLAIEAKLSANENLRLAGAFEQHRVWKQIDTPVDRNEWGLSPATVNAYYNSSFNEIVFPAAYLQPPHFELTADAALNYGQIGSVIGHEMTHGFDDEGRKFDAEGNLKMWWTDADNANFKARADLVVEQFNGYVGVDTLHVNGELTLGENIADLGGVKIAYAAYQKHLEKHGRQDIDGFTPEQRFFIGYGQSWRSKVRPEALRNQMLTDPHSPNYWRVNGPLSNSLEFRKAFGCKQGDTMVRPDDKSAQIW